MTRRYALALAAGAVLAATAAAADPIKLTVKDFTAKPSGGADDSLVVTNEDEGKIAFYVNGTATAAVKAPADGEYRLVIEASCDEAKNEKAKIKVSVGKEVVKDSFALTATEPKEYSFDVKLKKGENKLVIEYLNDEYKENEFDRNFALHSARLEPKK